MYLDRFYEFTPGHRAAGQRIVVILPDELRSRIDADWLTDALAHSDIVWIDAMASGGKIVPLDRPGEWQWAGNGASHRSVGK